MKPLLYQWHADPFVLLLVIALICFHYRLSGPEPAKERLFFWTAIGLILITTCSPLHFLAMHVYFSAHMIIHVILLLIAGPLLVMSISPTRSPAPVNKISVFLHKRCWLAWLAAVGTMWYWHIPSVFDASVAGMDGITIMHLLHTGSMLLAGMLFSWPLLGPFPEMRIHPLSGIIYLFTACISCSLLGLLITFAPIHTFHLYLGSGSSMKGMAYSPWGLTSAADQQAAGLIMWVPCCFVYLSGCLYLLHRWFTAPVSLTLSITKHE
jgi:cytochrome c oxidase assembly factor CtaG